MNAKNQRFLSLLYIIFISHRAFRRSTFLLYQMKTNFYDFHTDDDSESCKLSKIVERFNKHKEIITIIIIVLMLFYTTYYSKILCVQIHLASCHLIYFVVVH